MKEIHRDTLTLWFTLLAIGGILVLMFFLEGCAYAAGPSPIEDPRELHMVVLVECFSEIEGIPAPSVSFFEEIDLRPCDAPQWDDKCPAAGRAPGLTRIEFWGPYVRGEADPKYPPMVPEETAAHEVCHVSKHTYNELAASFCMKELVALNKCK